MLILEVALGVLIGFILILFLPSIVELFVLLIAYGLPVLFLLTIFLLVLGFSFFLYVSIGFYSVFILGALSFISWMLIRRFQEDFSKNLSKDFLPLIINLFLCIPQFMFFICIFIIVILIFRNGLGLLSEIVHPISVFLEDKAIRLL